MGAQRAQWVGYAPDSLASLLCYPHPQEVLHPSASEQPCEVATLTSI